MNFPTVIQKGHLSLLLHDTISRQIKISWTKLMSLFLAFNIVSEVKFKFNHALLITELRIVFPRQFIGLEIFKDYCSKYNTKVYIHCA